MSALSAPEPWDLVAQAYASDSLPLFEQFSAAALKHAGVTAGMAVVDVATGPGTLAVLAARAGAKVSAIDFSPNMVEALRRRGEPIEVVVGDGAALPYADATFDAGFSMFGLMFFVDRGAGFRELARVLKPGAPAVVSSWVPLDRIPLFSAAMTLAAEIASAEPLEDFALTEPDACRTEMTAGGFAEVQVHTHEVSFEVPSSEALVASLGKTNAAIVMIRRALGERWDEVARELVGRLNDRFGPGPHPLTMVAHLTAGRRA